uniref:Uncharacterized protein n=1 Tax=Acrobeloides nanus TaxID=290746 RepID=A0A914CDW7_9BILA
MSMYLFVSSILSDLLEIVFALKNLYIMIFTYSLYGLAALCAFLYLYTKAKVDQPDDARFISFQRSYLNVYPNTTWVMRN